MINIVNPYRPGSGTKPGYLAGRDDILQEAERCILSTVQGYTERSVAYYGLRGVGKTVLLNAIEDIAYELDVMYEHIEIKEDNTFLVDLSVACQKFIREMSLRENIKDKLTKASELLKRISVSWSSNDGSVSAQLSDYEIQPVLSNDLTDLFVTLGRIASETDKTIIFFIDEIQYIETHQLEALLMVLHRTNQLGLPILIFCAGLPKILKSFGEVKSYAERLFQYIEIDSLKREDAAKAIINPASDFGVSYEPNAINEILEITSCYPYFIQEICNTIWNRCENNTIALNDVIDAMPSYTDRLDNSFFQIRFDRCTEVEKEFMYAMVKCGHLPCTIANVASIMNRTVKSISPIRGKLINKGIIYPTSFGEIDFTVPQFDNFLKRYNPEIIDYLITH